MSKPLAVLFVCLGNICRSPAAEAVFSRIIEKKGLQDHVTIDSAGTAGYHVGAPADKRMRQHGENRGYQVDSICRQFQHSDFNEFDLIIVMDEQNYRNVIELATNDKERAKVKRMVDYSETYQYREVPDPYYGSAEGFELVLDMLEEACENLLIKLKEYRCL